MQFIENHPSKSVKLSLRSRVRIQIAAVALTVVIFVTTVTLTQNPPDYLPDRLARVGRRGVMYGYVFLPWADVMQSGVAGQYLDLVAQCLDFCFVHAQWSVCGTSNDTLDTDYLGNLTNWIQGLNARGVQVVVHIWVSTYSPSWMYPYTPELIGQKDRWPGIDPATTNATLLEHRNALKASMVHYQEMLCEYFNNTAKVGNDILGFCFDDETQSEYWTDFFAALATTTRSFNASWETMAMFNRIDKYHITSEAGMTINAMDPYDQDFTLVQKITYAYAHSGVDKLSVLLDAMGGHEDAMFHAKMRRQAWIAWFMGADSIGWYTFMYGSDEWACVRNQWESGQGPGITPKTSVAIETALDISKLNAAFGKISMESDAAKASAWTSTLLQAYALTKINQFDSARGLVDEVLSA